MIHWHEHKKGVAEAKAGTVDRGTVKELYLVHHDAQGLWGIDDIRTGGAHPIPFGLSNLLRSD